MKDNFVKIVIFVPKTHSEIMREAMGKAGAGKIGNYTFCSFSSEGVGRFLPNKDSNPIIGEVGKFESVEEERIEVVCNRELLKQVMEAIKKPTPMKKSLLMFTHWKIYKLIYKNDS